MTTNNRLLVLAGTATQAAAYLREQSLPLNAIVYVTDTHHIRGLVSPRYVIVGTFWERHNAIQIWKDLKLCFPPDVRKTMRAPDEIEKFLQPQLPPPSPVIPTCKNCGGPLDTMSSCPVCAAKIAEGIQKMLAHDIGPVETRFKHIKDLPRPNNGFKRIRNEV